MPAQSGARDRRWVRGSLDINILFAFGFGVVFLTTMLAFAVFFPNPTPIQVHVFVTTLGLAAAGVGAMLPGQLSVGHKPFFRATGAIALFAVVYFFQPAILMHSVRLEEPTDAAEPVALAYLKAVDAGDVKAAWDQLDPASIGVVVPDFATYERLIQSVRKALGAVEGRVLIGTGGAQSPDGYPVGLYRELTFRTQFAKGCRPEVVILRATSDLKWRVFSHKIGQSNIDC